MLAHSFVGFSPCWLGLLLLDLSGKNIMAEESASFRHQEADKEEEEGQGSQFSIKGHATNYLTSFFQDPLPTSSATWQ